MHLCVCFFPAIFCKLGEKKKAIAKGTKEFLEKMGPKLPHYEEKNLKVTKFKCYVMEVSKKK